MANEKRLIDKDKLIENCDAPHWCVWMSEIEDFPTVDAVEVVRCKDCKHYDNSEGICWCHLNSEFYPGGFDWHSFPEDGFCSYGERRTDESRISEH